MKDSIEQVLHFVFLGVLGGALFGPLAIAIPQIRELTKWKLPWPMKGQWPPGKPFDAESPGGRFVLVTTMDRVEDMRWDLVFTLTGAMIGQSIQIGLLVWWLI